MGFLTMVGCIIYAFFQGQATLGTVLLLVSIAAVPAFFLMWKSVVGRLFALHADGKDFKLSPGEAEDLTGAEGVCETPLHPSGIARLGGRRYDVVTRGEMLEKGAAVKVIEVSGNRIVVKQV
jgi:membrane-bound ClpP family serine protease